MEYLDETIEEQNGDLVQGAVLAAKRLRHQSKFPSALKAGIILADADTLLMLDCGGDVIIFEDGLASYGSGGDYAIAAARTLLLHTSLDAENIVREAMKIADEYCPFTNNHLTLEILPRGQEP